MSETQDFETTDDIHEMRAQPYARQLHTICMRWAMGKIATPIGVYIGYLVKYLLLFIGGWWLCCLAIPGAGGWSDFSTWALTGAAFQKAVLWCLFYEGIGLGCSSGPMTGRILPPIGGILHFARPGTTRLPLFPQMPLCGGFRRSRLDVALYFAIYAFLLHGLIAAEITSAMILPLVILLPILALRDKTTFAAFRGDHYYLALVALWYIDTPGEAWIAGNKAVWFGVWFWAATSKLNQHFPSIIAVMLTNSPFIPTSIHRRLFKDFPKDMRPSSVAATLAHFGTFAEYAFPIVLLWSAGGPMTPYALIAMVLFHSFIAGNAPSGMPVEWNIMMVYGGFVLFGHFAEVPLMALIGTPWLLGFLLAMLVFVPLLGNFAPQHVSFLQAMRYYAGNWAYSIWLFRDDSIDRLHLLTKGIPTMKEQLARLVEDEDEVAMSCAMTPAFRLMHIQGRAAHVPLAIAGGDMSRYEWQDGEMVAGMVLGWNFGDGHLHDEQLLDAVQEQCHFEEGELRVVLVESQPLLGRSMAWRVVDAKTGQMAEGESMIKDMIEWQPWPTGPRAEAFK
ncbi:MAG: DUF3556 domain-containing protein [Candidatus Binatia bacterium]|nr:DUF3556 domain-containing protein [Candidatus Binatia bacterium]MDG2008643.1 DUF3556 domain-containing protein [Candidatus Binatia bacterium]